MLVLLTVSCGLEATVTPINAAPRPMTARSIESVEVFTSTPPSRPHVDVALIEVAQETGGNGGGTAEMVARLRSVAAAQGCDAIHVTGLTNRGKGVDVLVTQHASDRLGLVASCLVYSPPLPDSVTHFQIRAQDPTSAPSTQPSAPSVDR